MRKRSFKENSHNLRNVCLGGILAFLSGFAYTVQNAVVANEEISFSEALTLRYLFLIFVLLVGTKLLREKGEFDDILTNDDSVYFCLLIFTV